MDSNWNPPVLRGSAEPATVTITAGIRPGEAERLRYARHIADMHSDNRLPVEEMKARIDLVWKASTMAELSELTRDLPALPEPPGRHLSPSQRTALRYTGALTAELTAIVGLWGVAIREGSSTPVLIASVSVIAASFCLLIVTGVLFGFHIFTSSR
jgi:hypothetical protein